MVETDKKMVTLVQEYEMVELILINPRLMILVDEEVSESAFYEANDE